jgi:hypothetical protein
MDWAVYGTLIAGTLAILAASVLVFVRAMQGWRALKRTRRRLARELEFLAETAERTGAIAERVSDQQELESSLARLRASLAQFNVLRAAVDEVTDSLDRLGAVYPRK